MSLPVSLSVFFLAIFRLKIFESPCQNNMTLVFTVHLKNFSSIAVSQSLNSVALVLRQIAFIQKNIKGIYC